MTAHYLRQRELIPVSNLERLQNEQAALVRRKMTCEPDEFAVVTQRLGELSRLIRDLAEDQGQVNIFEERGQ